MERLSNRTDAELKFRDLLKTSNIPFREEVILDIEKNKKSFIADFVIYHKHIIEIDGGYHFTKEMIERDKERDKLLKQKGYTIHHLKNEDVSKYNLNLILNEIFFKPPKNRIKSNKIKKNKTSKTKNNKDIIYWGKVMSANDFY